MDPEFNAGMQVFVLPNLYGDILTDIAAEYQGGLGTASSSNIGDQYAMFEAIHGVGVYLVEHNRAQYADPSSLDSGDGGNDGISLVTLKNGTVFLKPLIFVPKWNARPSLRRIKTGRQQKNLLNML